MKKLGFLLWVVQGLVAQAASSPCDLNSDGIVNAADVQLSINQSLGLAPCTADLDGDGRCDVVDVQRVITAALGGTCNAVSGLNPPVTVSLTPSSVSLLPSQNQTFTATVRGTSNTAVTWSINPALGGLVSGATTAVYVAPSTAPTTQSGTITATSMADPSKIATALITLLQAVTVSLSPSTVSLAPSGTQQFTATVLGTSNTAVTWSINPPVGTISSAGLYTAPSSILQSQTVTVTAQSVAALTKSARATISLKAATDDIRREALAPNSDVDHPLPLLSSWSTGNHWYYMNSGQYVPSADAAGFTADWVTDMIAQGHHMLPWMAEPFPGMETTTPNNCAACWTAYFQDAISRAAAINLPLNFVGTQWEQDLYGKPAYLNLPYAQNPNVFSGGVVQAKLSPFGATDPWYSVGLAWGSSVIMQQLQTWYQNPPLVIFLSNNEANRLSWVDAETDQHYLDLYGKGRSDDFKRQVFADGWSVRYKRFQDGFRDGLRSLTWKANAKFFGYNAFGPGYFGRWDGWKDYSLYVPNRIDPNPLYWDGGSPEYYITAHESNNDYTVFSPQMDAMNWEFIQNQAHVLNPSFWFEFSSTFGGVAAQQMYAAVGQTFTPERYGGFVQFAMWTERPRVVRDYPYNNVTSDPRSVNQPWMNPLIAAVDQVYNNSTLTQFWRHGQIVSNTTRPHPYQSQIPPEYSTVNRMFMLTTNLDPGQPWGLSTVIPVFALARVTGTTPNRQWLIYAFSPQANRTGVQVTIPGYRTVSVNATIAGAFSLADEASGSVSVVTNGPPSDTVAH